MNQWAQILEVLQDPRIHRAILVQLWQHLYISGAAMLAAVVVALPLGIALTRSRRAAEPVMNVVATAQTLPSLALYAFMIPLIGIGTLPAIVALFLYALLPILRNTYAGIRSVDPALIEAGRGMGMTPSQVLWQIELPLASRVILSGIRVSTVLIIGWATLAAYIGAGGLGDLIVTGFATLSTGHILAGGVPVTALALLSDWLLGCLERAMTPKGVRAA